MSSPQQRRLSALAYRATVSAFKHEVAKGLSWDDVRNECNLIVFGPTFDQLDQFDKRAKYVGLEAVRRVRARLRKETV